MQPESRHSLRLASALALRRGARGLHWLVLVLVLVIPGCAAQPQAGSPSTGASMATSGTPVGQPPDWPTSRLLVRSWTCLMCIYSMGTMVFDDGLVLNDGGGDGVIRARHLSPEGLAWVKGRLAESPLAAGSASYRAVPAPGAPPDLHEHTPHRFAVERDDTVVAVESDAVTELAGARESWLIPDEMLALEQLSKDLTSVDTWVPPDLWSDTWAPYRPERYLLVIEPLRDALPEDIPAAPDADAVPWPLAGRIDQVGTTGPGGDPQGERCLVIGPREFGLLAAAEAAMGVERSPDDPYVTNVHRWQRGNGALVVATRWLLPNEPSDCRVAGSDW
jgi:hypothetical protein